VKILEKKEISELFCRMFNGGHRWAYLGTGKVDRKKCDLFICKYCKESKAIPIRVRKVDKKTYEKNRDFFSHQKEKMFICSLIGHDWRFLKKIFDPSKNKYFIVYKCAFCFSEVLEEEGIVKFKKRK